MMDVLTSGGQRLIEDRVSSDPQLLDRHQLCCSGHDHRRAVAGRCDLGIDLQRDPLARRVVHDVVVVGQPKENLPVGDRVQNHHGPDSATGFVVQPALMMLDQ